MSDKPRMLVITPHPDDEILGVGGTMARFTQAGGQLTILTVAAHMPPIFTEEVHHQTIAEARKACDLLVVLTHSELQAAAKIAEENPQADVVIAGNAAAALKPRQVGNTLVLCAAPANTQEGDLRIYIGADGKFSFKFRSTDLDEVIPDDPAATAFADAARQERYKFRFSR